MVIDNEEVFVSALITGIWQCNCGKEMFIYEY